MNWVDALSDYFGARLDGETARRWWEDMTEGPNSIDTSNGEILAAIRHRMNEVHRTVKAYDVTLQNLRIWIFTYRKSLGESHPVHGGEQFLNVLKGAIRRALERGDREHAWNIICHPQHYAGASQDTTTADMQELEAFIMELDPDFQRPEWTKPGAFRTLVAKMQPMVIGAC